MTNKGRNREDWENHNVVGDTCEKECFLSELPNTSPELPNLGNLTITRQKRVKKSGIGLFPPPHPLILIILIIFTILIIFILINILIIFL